MDMQQHNRELKDMRRVARDEGITNTALAEYLKCPEHDIFNIMVGTTKEGDLRKRVYELLATNEVAAAWNKPLIVPRLLEDQAPVQPAPSVEPLVPAKVVLPAGHTEADAMRAAWLALGISQGDLAARFNRTGGSINPILMGYVTKGPLYDALREHLLEGKPAKQFEPWPPKDKPRPAPKDYSAAGPSDPPVTPPPMIVRMPPCAPVADDYATLMAQAMAAEELAEALKDLALLRQAEHRYNAAVAIARNVGLVTTPGRKTEAA